MPPAAATVNEVDVELGEVKKPSSAATIPVEDNEEKESTTKKETSPSSSEQPSETTSTAATTPPPAPEKPPFKFFQLLSQIHSAVVKLDGYPTFFAKYLGLQLIRLATSLSFLVVIHIISDDLDLENITSSQKIIFACLGIVNILGRLAPMAIGVIIDNQKEALQATQASSIVAKLFELEHDQMLSTPTGEFGQLIAKVFRNLDQLLPALYRQIIPVMIEVFVAVIFIGFAYGPVALLQLTLFVAFSFVSYSAAGEKAARNQKMMVAIISEWGKIIATAASYDRAHYFDNIKHEIAESRKSFERIGTQVTAVSSGEHKENAMMTLLTNTITIGFVMVLPIATNAKGIELASLTLYMIMFAGSLGEYAIGVSNLRSAVFEYQTFDEFLSRKSGVKDVPDAIDIVAHKNPVIEFKNVSFSYGGKVILDDISFKVNGGETVGLVGSSGCGKSTIMRLLLRFYRQSSGIITVDGHDITKVTGTSLRRLFSVVSQDAQLFNGTIRENIDYGKMGSTDEQILNAAKLAELDLVTEASNENDLTLDKNCGEKGAKLSGGQQQRLAIARCLLKNGSIFLLDEITTGLDGIVAKSLQKTLDNLSNDSTTITITHHLQDLQNANEILYLDQGKIVERGTYKGLIESKGEFYKQVEARNAA